jgi:type II secretory pathway component PulF
MTAPEQGSRLDSLILYTRQFAALVDAGISLRRILRILDRDSLGPGLAAANADLRERIDREETLSDVMRDHPAVFPPAYVAFVRAGEVGGVLDEALALMAEWLETERDAVERLRTRSLLLALAARAEGEERRPEAGDDAAEALGQAHEVSRVASFCRLFEMCLTAGVPMKLALTTAAEVLGDRAADEITRRAQGLGEGEPIAPVLSAVDGLKDFPVVAEMVATGEECDALDLLLRKAAEFIDAQAVHILHRAAPPAP